MPTYYVGSGGNDASNGLTWATRKLTLNGAEDVPVVAGDTVYVAPGVYRHTLTCDVSGGAGTPIVYIADTSGEHTDGVGGVVRVTGSDNDQTATRNNCIVSTNRDYRTFRGFHFDTSVQWLISNGNGDSWIIEDCTFDGGQSTGTAYSAIYIQSTALANTIRRCKILNMGSVGAIFFYHTADVDNTGHVVENCVIIGGVASTGAAGVQTNNIGGITIRHTTIFGNRFGVYVSAAPTAGQTITVNNCILCAQTFGFYGTAVTEIIENYNNLWAIGTPRTSTNIGANSVSYPPLLDLGILHAGAGQISGFRFPPPIFGALSQWSQVAALADTGPATLDILGLTRPVTAGKRSWGAVQYQPMLRETGTVHAGTASLRLSDAGRHQIYVPTANVSTVFSIWVYREANYAGVNPSMIVKQPGQADVTVTDAGAAGAWNQLTTTLTPAALPPYVVVELVSENTAAAGNYDVFFDDLVVT